MPRSRRALRLPVAGAVLSVGGTIAAILLLEALCRISVVESFLIRRTLFLQNTDLDAHRVSADPFLHYELAPDTQVVSRASRHGPCNVTIDPFGARAPTHPRVKRAGTFRILCFGGSTMYGAGVNDEQTIAARLEARLNDAVGTGRDDTLRFEVWNFGTSGYTLGQAAYLAKTKLRELDPDLIVVQHHNVGRRPYLSTPDVRVAGEPADLDHPDIGFFLEQFPVPKTISLSQHRQGLAHSALYRALTTFTPFLYAGQPWPCEACSAISADQARTLSLEAEARGVPVVYVLIPADKGVGTAADIFPEVSPARLIDLYQPGREPDFYDVHPPASVLDEYAARLVDVLGERRLLPAHSVRATELPS